MRRDDDCTADVLIAADKLELYLAGFTFEMFLRESKTQSAVIRELTVIGEAVKQLSEEFREQHPSVDWRGFAGMRDILTHQYFRVDEEEVWKAATVDCPELAAYLRPLLPAIDPGADAN